MTTVVIPRIAGAVAYDSTSVGITGGNTWFTPTGGSSGTPASCPVDVTEDTLATITIPPLSATSQIRVTTQWTITNSVNNKVMRVRFSGIGGSTYLQATLTTSATFVSQIVIANRGATNSQVGAVANGAQAGGFGASTSPLITSSVDTTASTTIVITGQKSLNSETITLESYLVEVLKP